MAMHRSAYAVHHGMGLSWPPPATHTRPRRADKVKGAAGMRYNAPAGLMSAAMRMKPGMKVRMLMTRSERAEPLSDFLSWLIMILLVLSIDASRNSLQCEACL